MKIVPLNRLQTVYLDTSVLNFVYADDAPERRDITKEFFENFIMQGRYNTSISGYVIDEINETKEQGKREKLLGLLVTYPIQMLEITKNEVSEIDELANQYLHHGIIPKKKKLDALHVATCIIKRIDYLVSWNFKHLANVNRERRILALNLEYGYMHPLRIITPEQLMDYGT